MGLRLAPLPLVLPILLLVLLQGNDAGRLIGGLHETDFFTRPGVFSCGIEDTSYTESVENVQTLLARLGQCPPTIAMPAQSNDVNITPIHRSLLPLA